MKVSKAGVPPPPHTHFGDNFLTKSLSRIFAKVYPNEMFAQSQNPAYETRLHKGIIFIDRFFFPKVYIDCLIYWLIHSFILFIHCFIISFINSVIYKFLLYLSWGNVQRPVWQTLSSLNYHSLRKVFWREVAALPNPLPPFWLRWWIWNFLEIHCDILEDNRYVAQEPQGNSEALFLCVLIYIFISYLSCLLFTFFFFG